MPPSNSVLNLGGGSFWTRTSEAVRVDRRPLSKIAAIETASLIATLLRAVLTILRIGIFLSIVLWPWQTVE